MTTATHHYDALDLFQHLVNNVLAPQAYDTPRTARTAQTQAQPTPQQAARQESRLVRMDVSETEDAYLILAEFPGIKKEEVNVTIEGKQITLEAQSQPEPAADGTVSRNLLSERFYGKMSRRIQLQQDIDDSAADAKFVDGVLRLSLPKKKLVSAKKLAIQ